ncbi:Ig-like domain-containing protein [Actinomadura sp. HBU206391]|uniref:L,D-transpeptidase n=1 Tax=Actinomadura sp. HBU206391 TaxID=2731692 RepID=UPI0021C60C2D|nr:Ig-like domain-containing protein [Actinomadura sp. HBU206391]
MGRLTMPVRLPMTLAVAAVMAVGCSSGQGVLGGKKSPAVLAFTPANGAQKVAPDAGTVVKVSGGKLTQVTVADAKGRKIEGSLASDAHSWRARWTLSPATTYTVDAQATGEDGKQVAGKATFTTLTPARRLESGMSPLDGEKVGVGMPVQLLLSQPVTTKDAKAAVERSLEVKMSQPVEGAWSWVGDREVQFRPRDYWTTGQKIKVIAHLAGVKAGNGLWGVRDRTLQFTVGARHITKVDAKAHKATVTDDGKTVRTIPVSLGKPGDDSYSGIMIAQEKNPAMVMDSATTGNPGDYRTPTKWNVRMTYSGTFFHSAPWSTGAQGNANVSHGCVNASPENARWFYDFTSRGDIIEVTGTTRKLRFGNGPTPWAKSWSEWLKGSALGKPVNAGAGAPAATPN